MCGGRGKIIKHPCHICNGTGLVDGENEIEVDIPKGVYQGMGFTMQGMGSAPQGGKGKYGELIIKIEEKESDKFIREGDDLYQLIGIPILDAITGSKIKVNTIDNKILETTIHQGTEDGAKIRFKGKGMPVYGSDKYGDMICEVRLLVPKMLNDKERKLIEELRKEEHFK